MKKDLETTTMEREIRQLALRLAEAGIPPEAIGQEMLTQGAGMLTQAHGSDHMVRLFEGLAETFRTRGPAMDAERQQTVARH